MYERDTKCCMLIVAPELSISNPNCEKENVTGDNVVISDDDYSE